MSSVEETVAAAAAAVDEAAAAAARGDNPPPAGEPPAGEPPAGEPPAGEPPRDDKGKFIPKARFDEAVQRERANREAAERSVAELQARLAEVGKTADTEKLETEILALEKQHAQAIIDGDAGVAGDLMSQIRLKERSIALSQSESMSATARTQAAEDVRFDMAVKALEETYPVLDPNNEDYDHDLVTMIIGAQGQLISAERLAPSAALVKATNLVMSKLMPAAKDGGKPEGLATASKGAGRVAKNIAAANRTPPSMAGAGKDTDQAGAMGKQFDVMNMSTKDLEALPPDTLARLRGDTL